MRLQNQVVLVTGGGSGIGQAISLLFAREGAVVFVADRVIEGSHSTVDQITAENGTAYPLHADVSVAHEIKSMVDSALAQVGRIDILVNNAALSAGDDILNIDEATWDLNLAVVLKSVYLCTKAVLPNMIARKRGAIVNISSVNGITGIGEEAYSAAKAGVLNLTKNLAMKYAQYGIRANAISPGTIQTPIWQKRVAEQPDIFERLAKWYPLGRVGQPEDVAKAALFLASDDASWITGINLPVDGGLTAGSYRMSQELGTT
jgi:meso-butanediol dehydrogenase / (S,S)-butanediol dehydrogenase / diacetyl reductase